MLRPSFRVTGVARRNLGNLARKFIRRCSSSVSYIVIFMELARVYLNIIKNCHEFSSTSDTISSIVELVGYD